MQNNIWQCVQKYSATTPMRVRLHADRQGSTVRSSDVAVAAVKVEGFVNGDEVQPGSSRACHFCKVIAYIVE